MLEVQACLRVCFDEIIIIYILIIFISFNIIISLYNLLLYILRRAYK